MRKAFAARSIPPPLSVRYANASRGEANQIEAARSDVFAEVSGPDHETQMFHLVEQLRLDQMNLSVVGGLGRLPGLIAMLDEAPGMGVAFDPVSCDQPDAEPGGFAEPVSTVAIDRDDLH